MKLPLDTPVIIYLTMLARNEVETEIGIIAGVNAYSYTVNLYGQNRTCWNVRETEVARAVFSFAGPVPVGKCRG